jgi:hypothetical protein
MDKDYKDWLKYRSRLENRDVSNDEQDYDLYNFYKSQKQSTAPGHLPDTFKRPNHPTFSEESMYHVPVVQAGGKWDSEGTFKPSNQNLQNMPPSQLQEYFNEVEGSDKLDIPKNKRFTKVIDRLKK